MKKIIVTNTFKQWIVEWNKVDGRYQVLLQRLAELEKTQEIVIMQLSDEEYESVSSYETINFITR